MKIFRIAKKTFSQQLKEDYKKLLRKTVNYTDSSVIYINGREIKEIQRI